MNNKYGLIDYFSVSQSDSKPFKFIGMSDYLFKTKIEDYQYLVNIANRRYIIVDRLIDETMEQYNELLIDLSNM